MAVYVTGLAVLWGGVVYILSTQMGSQLMHQWAYWSIALTFAVITVLAFAGAVIRSLGPLEDKNEPLGELYIHAPDYFILLLNLVILTRL